MLEKVFPRHLPGSCVSGASPASAPICIFDRRPSCCQDVAIILIKQSSSDNERNIASGKVVGDCFVHLVSGAIKITLFEIRSVLAEIANPFVMYSI
jgi:hypothetical protein